MTKTYISDLSKLVGQKVELQGWLYNKRSSGKIRFLIMRDGTGVCQCVMVKNNLSEEIFNSFDALTQESSFKVKGIVKQNDKAPGGYELELSDCKIISVAQEYPITPK